MSQKRRLPILALALVAVAPALTPRQDANPVRLSNDFVFRALAKETKGNAAVAPGGPLAALAALGAAGNALPESALRRVGGSTEAADRLLRSLDRSEQGLGQGVVLRHARSAWLSEPVALDPTIVDVQPASHSRVGAESFFRRYAVLSLPALEKKEAARPTGLATVSAFEAIASPRLMPLPKERSLVFDGKPVDSLSTMATGYLADDIAQTVSIPLTANLSHYLVLTMPREDAKLNDLMPEVGARVEQAILIEDEPAMVQLPRIVTTSESDVADALGLASANVAAQTQTAVTIGAKFIPRRNMPGSMGSPGGISMTVWHPRNLPNPGFGGSAGKPAKPVKEIPNVNFDRPFTYAVVEKKSRTILVAGIVRKIDASQK